MSKKNIPYKAKLVIGFFSGNNNILDKIEKILIKKYGKFDYKSIERNFNQTDYYNDEMGDNLKIRFLSFKKLINKSSLSKVKKYSWKLENKYSIINKIYNQRLVNIDPGFLSLENFILATGKGYTHRIYLNKGIWADLTFIYDKKEGYVELPWTYPSYKNDYIKKMLYKIRQIYQDQLRNNEK